MLLVLPGAFVSAEDRSGSSGAHLSDGTALVSIIRRSLSPTPAATSSTPKNLSQRGGNLVSKYEEGLRVLRNCYVRSGPC